MRNTTTLPQLPCTDERLAVDMLRDRATRARRSRRPEVLAHLGAVVGGILALAAMIGTLRGQATETAMEQPASGVDLLLTFDDVPMTHGPRCESGDVLPVTGMLIRALARVGAPAAVLVTPSNACDPGGPAILQDVLQQWVNYGAAIGNHTWSHLDYNAASLEQYAADVRRAEQAIAAALPDSAANRTRWFRHPLLHTGTDRARQQALASWLHAEGLRELPVTADNQEWVFARAYNGARLRGEDSLADRVADAYVAHVVAAVQFADSLARAVVGRRTAHVLLLHANWLNAERLPALLDALQAAGHRFVNADSAMADPVFNRAPHYVGPRGLGWMQRISTEPEHWALEGPREPDWVAAIPGPSATMTPVEALNASGRRFSGAYVANLGAALGESFADSAVIMPPDTTIVGRAAIQRYFRWSAPLDVRSHRMTAASVQLAGDVAIVRGHWRQESRRGDGPFVSRGGPHVVIWQRQSDRAWRIVTDIWHRPPPPTSRTP